MQPFTTPASVDEIRPGEFGLYKAKHVFSHGIPYIILALIETRGGLIAESYAMLPKKLLAPPRGCDEMPSQARTAFQGACQQLLHLRSEMDVMDAALFPDALNFMEAHRTDMFLTDGYLSPLGKVRELTRSEALKKYVDAVTAHYSKTA